MKRRREAEQYKYDEKTNQYRMSRLKTKPRVEDCESEVAPKNGAQPISTHSRNGASSRVNGLKMAEDEVVKGGANCVIAPLDVVLKANETPAGLEEMSLEDLATRINEGVIEIEGEVSSAKKFAEEALKAAIGTGHYLIAAQKRLERRGEWGTWIREKCPGLSTTTAWRYMALARKISHVKSDSSPKSLRQAYLAVGMVDKASSDGKSAADQTKAVTPGKLLSGLTKSLTLLQTLRKMSPTQMRETKPQILKKMADEVAELGEVCEEVKKKLLNAKEELAKEVKITKAAKKTQAKRAGKVKA